MAKIGRTCFPLVALLALAGCGEEGYEPVEDVPDGYTRYRTDPIDLEPGASGLWFQWVAAPADRPLDILDIRGSQSIGGHHALLMSTTDVQEVGYTRAYDNTDLLSSHIFGGVGGPNGEPLAPPPGVVFRVPAGQALVVQTHYLNTSDQTIRGESVLDIKTVEASDEHVVASQFTMTSLAIDVIPGGQTQLETNCVMPRDVELVMWTNHMHDLGTMQLTELTVGDELRTIKSDPVWDYEWAFNPNFEQRGLDEALVLPAGSTLRTSCNWFNDTGAAVAFPDEMCVFFGYYLGTEDLYCVDGDVID